MDEILNALQKVEESAEDVLKTKQEIIDLNVKLNKNREALNLLKRDPTFSNDTKKLWLCFGNSFVKTRISSTKTLITEDQNDLNQRINDLRNELKQKVDKLRELEGKPVLRDSGFDLKPLDRQELSALNSIMS